MILLLHLLKQMQNDYKLNQKVRNNQQLQQWIFRYIVVQVWITDWTYPKQSACNQLQQTIFLNPVYVVIGLIIPSLTNSIVPHVLILQMFITFLCSFCPSGAVVVLKMLEISARLLAAAPIATLSHESWLKGRNCVVILWLKYYVSFEDHRVACLYYFCHNMVNCKTEMRNC